MFSIIIIYNIIDPIGDDDIVIFTNIYFYKHRNHNIMKMVFLLCRIQFNDRLKIGIFGDLNTSLESYTGYIVTCQV